jgi:hypothetical protein
MPLVQDSLMSSKFSTSKPLALINQILHGPFLKRAIRRQFPSLSYSMIRVRDSVRWGWRKSDAANQPPALKNLHANINDAMFAFGACRPSSIITSNLQPTAAEDICPSALPIWRLTAELLPKDYRSWIITAESALLFAVRKLGRDG